MFKYDIIFSMKLNPNLVAFTGGGTGGHIYPGLAVADELKNYLSEKNKNIQIAWIGCSTGMDKKIVETAVGVNGSKIADSFYGIPSGKLRRYFSMKNFSDIFKIIGGFIKAFHLLKKLKPAVLFSKGGFVSVPPVIAAHFLKIPVYTHECDFSLGLANRINFKFADKMFVSYEETKNRFVAQADKDRIIVSGNPVRPVFYNTNSDKGFEFLGISKENLTKPVLMVLGGSSGARQINNLVYENIEWLCSNFVVVHQTGLVNGDEDKSKALIEKYGDDYKPYNFIYQEMPDVLACADVVLSRAGANSLWETAVLSKPMVLVPLCGNGTRGDQVDNADFFAKKDAAEVLLGNDANSENLVAALKKMLDVDNRKKYIENLKFISSVNPTKKIVEVISENIL